MRTVLSIVVALSAASLMAGSFGPEVPLTVAVPQGFAQELPIMTINGGGPVMLWREGSTKVTSFAAAQPVDASGLQSLDPVGYRDASAASIGDRSFGAWVENDWVYGVILDENGKPIADPTLYDQVDSRLTMRVGVGASENNYLLAFPIRSRVLTTMVDPNGNSLTWQVPTVDGNYYNYIEKVAVASDGNEYLLVWESTTAEPWLRPCDLTCPNENRVIHSMEVGSDGTPHPETELVLATDAGMPEVVWNGHEYMVVWRSAPDGGVAGRTVSQFGAKAGPVQTFLADTSEIAPHLAWDGSAYVIGTIHLPEQTLWVRRFSTGGTLLDTSGPLLSAAFPRQYALAVRDGKVFVSYVSGVRLMVRAALIAPARSRAVRH